MRDDNLTRQNSSTEKTRTNILNNFTNISKAEFGDKERKKLAKEKEAESDGSYPIRNKEDLKNAIHAYGRSKDKEKTKNWIKKRAKELNCESCLPEEWTEKCSDGLGKNEFEKCDEIKKAYSNIVDLLDISKAHVKAYTRKSKIGKIVNVK